MQFFLFSDKSISLWHKPTHFFIRNQLIRNLLVTTTKFKKFLLVKSYFIFRLRNLLSHLKVKVLAFLPCLRTFLGLTLKSNFRNSLHFTYFLSKNEKPFKRTFLGKLMKNDETFCRGSFSRFLINLFYKETLYKKPKWVSRKWKKWI